MFGGMSVLCARAANTPLEFLMPEAAIAVDAGRSVLMGGSSRRVSGSLRLNARVSVVARKPAVGAGLRCARRGFATAELSRAASGEECVSTAGRPSVFVRASPCSVSTWADEGATPGAAGSRCATPSIPALSKNCPGLPKAARALAVPRKSGSLTKSMDFFVSGLRDAVSRSGLRESTCSPLEANSGRAVGIACFGDEAAGANEWES